MDGERIGGACWALTAFEDEDTSSISNSKDTNNGDSTNYPRSRGCSGSCFAGAKGLYYSGYREDRLECGENDGDSCDKNGAELTNLWTGGYFAGFAETVATESAQSSSGGSLQNCTTDAAGIAKNGKTGFKSVGLTIRVRPNGRKSCKPLNLDIAPDSIGEENDRTYMPAKDSNFAGLGNSGNFDSTLTSNNGWMLNLANQNNYVLGDPNSGGAKVWMVIDLKENKGPFRKMVAGIVTRSAAAAAFMHGNTNFPPAAEQSYVKSLLIDYVPANHLDGGPDSWTRVGGGNGAGGAYELGPRRGDGSNHYVVFAANNGVFHDWGKGVSCFAGPSNDQIPSFFYQSDFGLVQVNSTCGKATPYGLASCKEACNQYDDCIGLEWKRTPDTISALRPNGLQTCKLFGNSASAPSPIPLVLDNNNFWFNPSTNKQAIPKCNLPPTACASNYCDNSIFITKELTGRVWARKVRIAPTEVSQAPGNMVALRVGILFAKQRDCLEGWSENKSPCSDNELIPCTADRTLGECTVARLWEHAVEPTESPIYEGGIQGSVKDSANACYYEKLGSANANTVTAAVCKTKCDSLAACQSYEHTRVGSNDAPNGKCRIFFVGSTNRTQAEIEMFANAGFTRSKITVTTCIRINTAIHLDRNGATNDVTYFEKAAPNRGGSCIREKDLKDPNDETVCTNCAHDFKTFTECVDPATATATNLGTQVRPGEAGKAWPLWTISLNGTGGGTECPTDRVEKMTRKCANTDLWGPNRENDTMVDSAGNSLALNSKNCAGVHCVSCKGEFVSRHTAKQGIDCKNALTEDECTCNGSGACDYKLGSTNLCFWDATAVAGKQCSFCDKTTKSAKKVYKILVAKVGNGASCKARECSDQFNCVEGEENNEQFGAEPCQDCIEGWSSSVDSGILTWSSPQIPLPAKFRLTPCNGTSANGGDGTGVRFPYWIKQHNAVGSGIACDTTHNANSILDFTRISGTVAQQVSQINEEVLKRLTDLRESGSQTCANCVEGWEQFEKEDGQLTDLYTHCFPDKNQMFRIWKVTSVAQNGGIDCTKNSGELETKGTTCTDTAAVDCVGSWNKVFVEPCSNGKAYQYYEITTKPLSGGKPCFYCPAGHTVINCEDDTKRCDDGRGLTLCGITDTADALMVSHPQVQSAKEITTNEGGAVRKVYRTGIRLRKIGDPTQFETQDCADCEGFWSDDFVGDCQGPQLDEHYKYYLLSTEPLGVGKACEYCTTGANLKDCANNNGTVTTLPVDYASRGDYKVSNPNTNPLNIPSTVTMWNSHPVLNKTVVKVIENIMMIDKNDADKKPLEVPCVSPDSKVVSPAQGTSKSGKNSGDSSGTNLIQESTTDPLQLHKGEVLNGTTTKVVNDALKTAGVESLDSTPAVGIAADDNGKIIQDLGALPTNCDCKSGTCHVKQCNVLAVTIWGNSPSVTKVKIEYASDVNEQNVPINWKYGKSGDAAMNNGDNTIYDLYISNDNSTRHSYMLNEGTNQIEFVRFIRITPVNTNQLPDSFMMTTDYSTACEEGWSSSLTVDCDGTKTGKPFVGKLWSIARKNTKCLGPKFGSGGTTLVLQQDLKGGATISKNSMWAEGTKDPDSSDEACVDCQESESPFTECDENGKKWKTWVVAEGNKYGKSCSQKHGSRVTGSEQNCSNCEGRKSASYGGGFLD